MELLLMQKPRLITGRDWLRSGNMACRATRFQEYTEGSSFLFKPMIHAQANLNEWIYILQGEYEFQVGQERYHLKAGTHHLVVTAYGGTNATGLANDP